MSSSTARQVWNQFCDDLKGAGAILDDPATPADALTQAEGVRYLARIIAVGLEVAFEHADTEHPWVFLARTPWKLTGGVCPDAIYHEAFIDGTRTYRLRGTRGTAPMLEIGVYAGKLGLQEHSRLVGQVIEDDVTVADDGTFELLLSPDPGRAPDILLEPDASYIYIRNYSLDWSQEEAATFDIRCEDTDAPPAPLQLGTVQGGLEAAATYIQDMPRRFATAMAWNRDRSTNTLVAIDPGQDTTMPGGHQLSCGYYLLEPGQSLRVRFDPDAAPYWSLGLCNYWMEPLDWRWRTPSINARTAGKDADGKVTAVISATAPSAGNWLDTGGHREGLINFRWARTSAPLPAFEVSLLG